MKIARLATVLASLVRHRRHQPKIVIPFHTFNSSSRARASSLRPRIVRIYRQFPFTSVSATFSSTANLHPSDSDHRQSTRIATSSAFVENIKRDPLCSLAHARTQAFQNGRQNHHELGRNHHGEQAGEKERPQNCRRCGQSPECCCRRRCSFPEPSRQQQQSVPRGRRPRQQQRRTGSESQQWRAKTSQRRSRRQCRVAPWRRRRSCEVGQGKNETLRTCGEDDAKLDASDSGNHNLNTCEWMSEIPRKPSTEQDARTLFPTTIRVAAATSNGLHGGLRMGFAALTVDSVRLLFRVVRQQQRSSDRRLGLGGKRALHRGRSPPRSGIHVRVHVHSSAGPCCRAKRHVWDRVLNAPHTSWHAHAFARCAAENGGERKHAGGVSPPQTSHKKDAACCGPMCATTQAHITHDKKLKKTSTRRVC